MKRKTNNEVAAEWVARQDKLKQIHSAFVSLRQQENIPAEKVNKIWEILFGDGSDYTQKNK